MNFCKMALSVIETEAQAVMELSQRIGPAFEQACTLLINCTGRVVVTGMGKSGHIGNKIAATMASTGTPAFFMHPAEASHGDLGMLTPNDVVLAISYSGQTQEILTLLPLIKRMRVPLISMTGNQASMLSLQSDVHLDVQIEQEACPLGLAPTTSTTVSLVMGDALAIALLNARGFSADDFALAHPGGSLGRRLLLLVDDIAHKGTELPIVHEDATVSEAIIEVTEKKLGMTCVVNRLGELCGIYTDGDIRRTITNKFDINNTHISKTMTRHCKTISPRTLAAEALGIMQEFKITSLVICDHQNKPTGVVHLHDLLKAGVI